MAKIELIIGFIILLCAVVLLSVWYKEKQMKKEKELEKLMLLMLELCKIVFN